MSKNFRFFLIFVLLYLLAHGLRFIHLGIYWDDWAVVNIEPLTVFNSYIDSGRPISALLHRLVLSSQYPKQVYLLIHLFCYLATTQLFFLILRSYLNQIESLLITFLFVVLPINSARHTLHMAHYEIYMLFFSLGSYLLFRSKNVFSRILSLFLFLLSFGLECNLVLFFGILLSYFILEENLSFKNRNYISFLIRKLDYFLLPFAFWLLRLFFFSPQNLYESSYSFRLSDIALGFLRSPIQGLTYILNLFSYPNYVRFADTLLIIMGFIGFFLFLIKMAKKEKVSSEPNILKTSIGALFGFILFVTAIAPFIVTGRIPLEQDWAGRFAMMGGFGLSIFIFFTVKIITRKRIFIAVSSLVIALFWQKSATFGLSLLVDGLKQRSISFNLKENPELLDANNLIVMDYTRNLNNFRRVYRFYEYTGIFKEIYPNESKFAIQDDDYIELYNENKLDKLSAFFGNKAYSLSNAKYSQPTDCLIIVPGPNQIGEGWKSLPKILNTIFDGSDENIRNIVKIKHNKNCLGF